MKYRGSYCALVTPFKNDEIDTESFKKIINRHIESGTRGIIPCGTTGESPTLSHDEHKYLIDQAVRFADGKIQVIAGTGSNSTKEAISLTKYAKGAGADSSLIVVPYYNKPNQIGLRDHFLKIANEVDFPLFIYNIPGRSVVDMNNDTVIELANHENIIGIKDASNDLSRPAIIKKFIRHKHFYQLSGEDGTQLGFLAQGGDGVISVTANLAPSLLAKLQDSWHKNDFETAILVDRKLTMLNKLLFVESNPCPVKFGCYYLGLCNYEIRLPLTKISKTNEIKLIKEMEELKLSK